MLVRNGTSLDEDRLDVKTDNPNTAIFKKELEEIQSEASDYYRRIERCNDWWFSRWPNQTYDGLKWADRDDVQVWPWEGSSDTRVGFVSELIADHQTVCKYALMNAHVQGKASRPAASGKESERATILMNWLLYVQMLEEIVLEVPLLTNWRNGYGAAILWTDWEQERRIEYVPISLMSLQAFSQQSGGNNPTLDYIQNAISDPAQEDSMVQLVQMMSPIVSKGQARGMIDDLRKLRTTDIPVPYVYKSKPRWIALQPMVDILFPPTTDDIQRARFIDRVEYVTETELVDRIETAAYDPNFVDEALDHKGQSSNQRWANRSMAERNALQATSIYYNGKTYADFDDKIELHHIYYKCLDKGAPTLYRTVFHYDVEEPAKHGPYGYKHGKYPCDALRFEKKQRPILSSRGICERAYTWEQEIKKQRDGRTDMTDLSLRPPMFAEYKDVLRIKTSFAPGVIWPRTRGTEMEFMQIPSGNQSSIQIEETVRAMAYNHFGLFGEGIDPQKKQLRQQELADDFLMEMKRPIMQVWQLAQQFLPDDEVAQVTGPLSRPFQVDRSQIQGQFEFSVTVDLRETDKDWIKEKGNQIQALMSWDKSGIIDTTPIIRRFFEQIDYTLADESIKDQQSVTNREIENEHDAISKLIGSGLDQPLPEGSNYQLRSQVLQNTITEAMKSNPVFQKKLRDNPELMDLLKNRLQYFQRQMQQRNNAVIGKTQVSNTFNKEPPMLSAPPMQ